KERANESWEMEPHADFMAGWAIAQYHRDRDALKGASLEKEAVSMQVERAVHTMLSFGETSFNNRDHHGGPTLRAAKVRAGFEGGNLGVKEAFEKGTVWTNLKRGPT